VEWIPLALKLRKLFNWVGIISRNIIKVICGKREAYERVQVPFYMLGYLTDTLFIVNEILGIH
jgi:hypothetical protein